MNMRVVLPVLCLAGIAQATPPNRAIATFRLQRVGAGGIPMEVGFHPQFNRYYAVSGEDSAFWVWTYDNQGKVVSGPTEAGADIRSLNYNPNTGALEVVQAGDSELRVAEIDQDGNWVDAGTSAGVIIQKPHSQSMPVYDPASDCFYAYAASGSSNVSVISRTSGLITGTIELDLDSAGIPPTNLTSFACGFLEQMDWLVVFDFINNDAVVFDTLGNYCGTSGFTSNVESSFGCGSANGQLWVFDSTRNGWRGYSLSAECPDPNECGDFDGDGDSDGDDFFAYLDLFSRRDVCADLDLCGDVDSDDFFVFLDRFVNPCP